MSKPSRLVKPSKQSRKEPPGNRSRMLIVGERLMRAGSEGNLVRPRLSQQQDQQQPDHSQDQAMKMLTRAELVRGDHRACSVEDAGSLDRRQSRKDQIEHLDPWSPRTVPRRHTVPMQPHNLERRKEAFLEHLKQKYPHHASTIMGHQERFRDQAKGPVHSGSPQPSVVEQGERPLESVEAMSEGEAPAAFTRGSRTRASLPAVKSSNYTKDRSLGVLYLQYGEETRQILMPSEVTTVDTVRALFVSAFPQQLNLKMLESPSIAIYIKDHARNVYYELTDVRNITPHSCLKLYHKDPAQAFNHTRSNNGDARISRERLYGHKQHPSGQSLVHTLPHPQNPIRNVQGSMSPPAARSMPSSPSRLPYGSRTMGSATLPRERLSSAPAARSATPSSSAILERRDVKPDEDVSPNPYGASEARLSLASSQDVPDGAVFLPHRYSEISDSSQHSMYRQKSRKYSENQHVVPLGPKTPPASPHRMGEFRMIDVHPGQNTHLVERASPGRRSIRKDSNGAVEVVPRVRNMSSPVFADLPPGHGDRPFQGTTPTDAQSQRMKAMEQQIASLTGLVQHALLKGTNTSGVKETPGEKPLSASPAHSGNSGGGSPVAVCKSSALQTEPSPGSAPPATEPPVSSILAGFQKNVSTLRQQLQQLRHMQLQNQESVRFMLQQMERDMMQKVSEQLKVLDDPLQKQRREVDEERRRYQDMEKSVLLQLGDLEKHVENLKRDSTSNNAQRPVTLRDVEEGAVNLRKVGEALAALKGEFPALQMKMRSVLRVEVEAVRFLKEEPNKMDCMLKRVKSLTETLGSLRRGATEGHLNTDPMPMKPEEPDSSSQDSPTPQPRGSCTEHTPSSPGLVQRVQSAPVNLQPCQLSAALSHHSSPPLTSTHNRDTPTIAMVSPRSREHSPALQKKSIINNCTPSPTTVTSITSVETTTTPPTRHKENTAANNDKLQLEEAAGSEMERILQQAQANLMKAIPDLEVTVQQDISISNPPTNETLPDEVDCPQLPGPAPEVTAPAEPVAEKPVQLSTERLHKAPVEKPHRASVDKAKPSSETAGKSPPPPPPRRFYPQATGLTTGRSGEVIYTSRKEPTPPQESEEGAIQPKPQRVPPEVKPKPQPPPPINTSAAPDEEENDEDKIIAELQVFEKCPVKELEPRYVVDLTTHELPDTEAAFSLSSYDPKNTAHHSEDEKHSPNASAGSGVIYYITGTAKAPGNNLPKEPEVPKESKEGIVSSKVANLNASDISERPSILTSYELTLEAQKSVEECQKDSTGIQQIPVSPSELLKDPHRAAEDDTVVVSKRQSAESVPKRSEKQVISTSESPMIVTETSSSVGSVVQTPVVSEAKVSGFSGENGHQENEQQVVMRSSRGRARYTEDASLSPDLPGEEAPPPPPPDNIAFMITKTKVKALSNGEYQQLVSSKGQDVETVKVGTDTTASAPEDGGFNKKPVIILFEEPMDIRQAYKRLSTIFECEEELDKMLAEETIDEETEETEEEDACSQGTRQEMTKTGGTNECRPDGKSTGDNGQHQNSPECSSPESEDGSKVDLLGDSKQEGKKKFKFKFPKKQLAAIGQALRTGTKTGKKTLQVVVYEDEEEADGTVKQAREAKRFEIKSQVESVNSPGLLTSTSTTVSPNTVSPLPSKGRSNEICKTTYKTLDSLEETIKQLETTISDMDPALSPEASRKELKTKRITAQTVQGEAIPSKRPTPQVAKPQKSLQRKKPKGQSASRPSSSSSSSSSGTKQNTGGSPSSSRISSPRSRQQAGSAEKPSKSQKIQDSQRQFRQANGGAIAARGSSKYAFLALPASKIPAFCPSSGKSSSASAPISNTSKPSNHPSLSSKSSIPCLSLSRMTPPSNESLRVPGSSQPAQGYGLSHSAQTHSAAQSSSYSSSSSSSSHCSSSSVSPTSTSSSSSPSSPSLLSPTAVSQAGRPPHIPGFSSPRPQTATSTTSSNLPTTTPAPSSKDTA